MTTPRKIFLLLVCGALWAQDHPFKVGEQLEYQAGFRLLAVGTMTLEITGLDSSGPDTTLMIVSQVRTLPVFDPLYRIDDRVDLWLDHRSLELRRVRRNINEGRYHRRDSARVDIRSGLIYTAKDTINIEGPVLDPIGAIYYFRSLALELGDRVEITIFDGKRLRDIAVLASEITTIKVPAGELECLLLVPSPLDDRPMTKVGGFLRLWLTNDAARIPARVEQQTNFGTMVLKLAKYRLE
ncbi:MAG: DUF3108 domain-containing protein [Candidatus Marinimicrobia bacterium]|nr:DUF3108 domain-containing protein [Candidatus Neomarinimicrobiota bacterium]